MKRSEKDGEDYLGLPESSISILLVMDGSIHSQDAALGLSALPLPVGSKVLVLAVAQEFNQVTRAEPYILLKERQAHEIRNALRKAHTSLSKGHIHIEMMIRSGQSAEVITRTATEYDVDLIVLGTEENTTKPKISPGSTTQKVIKYAQQPVLVLRKHLSTERFLLVVDGSTMATKALDYLLQWPWPTELDVFVLHVSFAPFFPWLRSKKVREGEKNARIKNGQAIVNRVVESLRSGGLQAAGLAVKRDATYQILKLAEEKQVDLILLSTNGRPKLIRYLLGNVSHRVVHDAPCSVLVVRT